MDIKLTKLLINETRKSLEKLNAAEQKFYAENKEDIFNLLISDSGYVEAEHEVMLFAKQLETQTGVSFELQGGGFLSAAMVTQAVEPKLKAIEQVALVLSRHCDSPECNNHQ